VLERWGLLIQYYSPFFMQNILAQTEFVREDNGIIALKSLPNPELLRETPLVPADADLGGVTDDPGHLKLRGYTLEGKRLTLYWEVVAPVRFNYTVFVNVQNEAGETATQVDHPLWAVFTPPPSGPPARLSARQAPLTCPPATTNCGLGCTCWKPANASGFPAMRRGKIWSIWANSACHDA